MADGSPRIAHIPDMYKHRLNYSEENALFCLNFVIDTALKFQSESFGLINRNKFQLIKTKGDNIKVHSYVRGAFSEIGKIEKDKIIDHAKLTRLSDKGREFWKVNYENKEGYIELNDVEWIKDKN